MEYNNSILTYSSSLEVIDPSTLFTDGYELSNQTVIESTNYQGSFTPGINNCEFYVYDANKTIITSDYNYAGLTVPNNPNPTLVTDPKTGVTSVTTTTINLTPESDVVRAGFTFGKMYAVYNFVNLELGSSIEVPYYLAEISSDRTEIRLKSNFITTRTMKTTTVALQNTISNPQFFDEIYISFGNNEYHIGVNIKYDDSIINVETNTGPVQASNAIGQASILIKLYDPLPSKYSLLDELYVVTKTAESQAYLVNFVNDFKDNDNIIRLKGPNSNLKINDFVNNSSIKKNKKELLGTKSTGSKDQLLNVLNQRGVQIAPNYSTGSFGEFINFSSAKSQVSNFVEKVSRIQTYEADLNIISRTTASNVGNVFISESIASIFTKIQHEITAFSGFEYYQYYSTGSDAYPKTGSTFPFELLPTQSALSQNWITAAETSGSLFDGDNQNWLYYTVPGFIKENSSNANYLEFTNMVGQSFDEVWLYTKAIAEKSNTTNQLDKGVPLQLADDVITSLGYTGFGNNYNNQDNFFGLIGSDNGDLLPPTGSEMVSHQIAVNGPGGVLNYWEDSYTDLDYVDVERSAGFPYPIDKVSKEIFKRLYHNMSYLVKKKGTVSGLRQLINIWGIPNTILRINEFGGKNKDEEDDYDLWYQRYSYAYSPVPSNTNYASSSVRIPWQPLYRNYIHSHNKLTGTVTGTQTFTTNTITNGIGGFNFTSNFYNITTQFTVTGGGTGGTIELVIINGNLFRVNFSGGSGYTTNSVVTITATQVNNLNDPQIEGGYTGEASFPITNAMLGAEQIVPDGLGFRFKTTGYPSSSFGGAFDSQSLFIKKSTNADTDADFGIILNYTGSTSGSHSGSTSSKYVDYGEMRFFLNGSQLGGDTALSPPIYLPFFDKGWWNVQLQRDQHPIVTDNNKNTTYTLYVANKIYDGADGNQIGFQGSASIYVNVDNASPPAGGFPLNANSASLNKSWNDFSIDLAQYGAGAYVGGWGNTLTTGETGSMGILSDDGGSRTGLPKGIQNAGKNFSGSLQEFRYYSNDISQSVFNDAVMNPESIEGNFITGSESSFDIINFRAPLGNELESRFTSSFNGQYIDQVPSVHPAVSGSSPLIITASFYNPATVLITSPSSLTSSYDVTYNANGSLRTYSTTNVETYFLDQPSIGIRNRVSNKIKYSSNLNFGNTLSNKVSIQQNPPVSQSYTDNINSLEVAFSPTEEVNDDIIQSLGYGSIQEVIADPRFRSSSDDYYPGLRAISDDYFKKYTNRSQIDYLRLIKYFDDSLFKAIKNYVPARTSVSTGIVIKQHMLERSRYREPQVNIVTTQSYAPFNQPLTTKNLELTGSVNTNQLWDPLLQTTYYSASDIYNFEAGPGGSVNQYNTLEEGGGLFILENDDFAINATPQTLFEVQPLQEVSQDIILINANDLQSQGTATIRFGSNTSQTTTPGNADADHSITIITINPSDGSTITKSYCTSNTADTGTVDGGFIRFRATGNATAKAAQFIDAINSVNGQGSGATTPTLTAIVDPSLQTQVILTQLYGGTDGNTLITYGSLINTSIGKPTFVSLPTPGSGYAINQSITLSPTTATSGIGTGLTVSATTDGSGVIDGIGTPGGGTVINYAIGDEFSITNLLPNAGNGRGAVSALSKMLDTTPSSFTGGTALFKNTFLNALKSIRTPIYIDYNFTTTPSNLPITIEASSSIRGTVLTNTTIYNGQADPPGSILVDADGINQYLNIHPGEDMYMLISAAGTITIDDYQVILGESIIITTSRAAETTAASTTLLIDNISDDQLPVVGSVVTGPNIKAGVVTTLGAVQTAGTGYDPSTVQVLATTGAGGGNLTLTVTTNASGNVTTAALSNPGTGYTTNDVVTIVGGDNNATVAITVATSRTITVEAFDPTNNQVTFNELQSITNNSKITFTETVIPDADTIPVSQQGYFVNNVTPEGIDTSWDNTQEQFYDGEYSGSNIIVDQYFKNQYNPYRKVKPNSTLINNIINDADPSTATYVSMSSPTAGIGSGQFSVFSADGFDFDNTSFSTNIRLSGLFSQSIIPYQDYLLTYDISTTVGTQNNTSGISGFSYVNIDGELFSNRNGIGFLEDVGASLQTRAANTGTETTAISHSFKGINLNPAGGDNGEVWNNVYMSAMFDAQSGIVGTVSNLKLQGIGGIYDDPRAPIFLTQQDKGYNNQKDYQVMSKTREGTIGISTEFVDPIWLIENTQSVIFNNSDYNPINNNININRSSSYRYVLSYGNQQYIPSNFSQVVTQSYFPYSPSASFPELADVPDSNYTMPSSINARYNGSKLSSLTYNFFTPSGSVGPEIMQPIMPVNKSKTSVGFRIANEFLDGSVTSSFDQTPLGAGSASWQGDSRQNKGESTIDKHPIYMARFENSYEQLNLYNSYQYNIDQLIEVPFESIAGIEVTPNSITIDGSNESKKIVSSVFEPKRKAAVSYLNPKTKAINYSTMQVGNYDILSGATEFLTINSNAKSRVSASLLYNYSRGGQLVTSSLTQDQGTIQMVTGSNTVGNPATEGQLDTATTLTFVSGVKAGVTYNVIGSIPSSTLAGIQSYQLQTVGGPGSGGAVDVIFNGTNIISTSGGSSTGGINTSGTGYVLGSTVKIEIISKGSDPTITMFFTVGSTNILTNPEQVTFNGFLLSGSLTTGNIPPLRNTSLVVGTPLTFTGGASGGTFTAGTIVVPAYSSYISISTPGKVIVTAQGSGAMLAVTCDASAITKVNVVDGGSGYRPGDQLGVFAEDLNDVMRQGANGAIIKGLTTGFLTQEITELQLAGESSPFQLNFNPSAVSSSFVTSSIQGATTTLNQQLLIGGPQLALFHAFNATVSSSLFSVNTTNATSLNVGPQTSLWTTSGSNPANSENYYNWSPEFSDCKSYTNTNTPYLIERGDIIRVEGTLNTITAANISQSTNTIQDFIVEEVQDFNYTSSFAAVYNFDTLRSDALTTVIDYTVDSLAPATNATYTNRIPSSDNSDNGIGAILTLVVGTPTGEYGSITFTNVGVNYKPTNNAGQALTFTFVADAVYAGSPAVAFTMLASAFETTPIGETNTLGFTGEYDGAFANTNTKGTVTPGGLTNNITRIFDYEINTTQASQLLILNSNSTGSTTGVGGTVSAQIKCSVANGIEEWTFTGGTNIPEGTRFSIDSSTVQNATTGWDDNTATAFEFVMQDGCIIQQPTSNNFTIGTDVAASATSTPESGSQVGFHNYEKGEVGFTAPTFIRVTPNPLTTLNGLNSGEVTKMTIRRQIEADDKVMLKNVAPPSGSLGVETPSGQGFLIPNDFSKIQKDNALNIINQLKAKNAFDKPNEPGITDGGGINPSSGTSFGGGGEGGIR